MKILNIAAGKLITPEPYPWPPEIDTKPRLLVNIDDGYFERTNVEDVDKLVHDWESHLHKADTNIYCKEDINEYMERCIVMYDKILVYRYLEHVSFVEVPYFIYLMSTVLKEGGLVDVIVPNYEVLASMILKEKDIDQKDFPSHDILLTTELLNEPSCPHASIWTPTRAAYFFSGLESRFKILSIQERYEFDGRDIYMRVIAKKK